MAVRKKIDPARKRPLTVADAIRKAFTTNDADALEAGLAALDADPDDDEPMGDEALPGTSPSNVNINFGERGMPALDELTKLVKDGFATMDAKIAAQDAQIAGMMTQFQISPDGTIAKRGSFSDAQKKAMTDAQAALDAAIKAQDAEGTLKALDAMKKACDPDPDNDLTDDGKPGNAIMGDKKPTGDAALPDATQQTELSTMMTATISLAEILSPGLRIPTFDAALSVGKSKEVICNFKRQSIISAMAKADTFEIIKPITGDSDVLSLTCDQANAMFVASAELVRASRRKAVTTDTTLKTNPGSVTFHTAKPPLTPSEINKRNAEFLRTHGQVGS
jgi:hypothetical protein